MGELDKMLLALAVKIADGFYANPAGAMMRSSLDLLRQAAHIGAQLEREECAKGIENEDIGEFEPGYSQGVDTRETRRTFAAHIRARKNLDV